MLGRLVENERWRSAIMLVLSILMALVVGALFMLAGDYNPVEVYSMMVQGGFVGIENILNTLQRATPLIFTGLAVLAAFETGMFNIGVEGQLYIGAITATWLGFALTGLPPVIHPLVALVGGMLAGAAYALVPAALKVKLQVNEIITTIMANTTALLLTSYLVNYPLRESPMAPRTPFVLKSAELPQLVPYSQVNVGVFIALGFVFLFWFLLTRTTLGYRMRMVGTAAPFAECGGINVASTAVIGMLISGALAGLAGGIEILGVHRRFVDQFSIGLGFDGILVAWLGKGSPVGVLLAALFYGGLKNGAMTVDLLTDMPRELANTILAIVIFFLAAEGLFEFLWKRKKAKKPQKVEVKLDAARTA